MTWRERFERMPAWFWVLAALALRAAFALKLGGRLYQIDELGFHDYALHLARTGMLGSGGQPIAAVPIPFAFFAVFYAIFGDHLLIPRLAQAAVGAATAWMIGRATEEFSGSRLAGRLALALAAIYPFFIYYSGILMSETLYVAAVVAALWMTGRSWQGGSTRAAGLCGLAWAAAALCRVEAAPIAAVVWVAALARLPRRAWAAALLCWALPLAAWSARNKCVAGTFSLDNHGGITLLHGTLLHEVAQAEDTSVAVAGIMREPWFREAQKFPEAERQKIYARKALEFMKENPGRTLRHWGQKFVAFWRFYPRLDKVYRSPGTGAPDIGLGRWVLVAVSLCFEPWLIILGWLGLWRLRRAPALWPAWIFIVCSTGVHVLIVSMMRYRLAVMPFMILGACAWLAAKWERPLP